MESERLFFEDLKADKELDNTKMYIMLKKLQVTCRHEELLNTPLYNY